MKLSRKVIVNAQAALGRLGTEKFTGANAGKITYNIARNIGSTEPIVKAYQKAQNAILEKYRVLIKATKEGEEDLWIILDKDLHAYRDESESLLSEEEDVTVFLVTLPAATDEKPLPVNGLDRYALDWFLKVEGEE